ncbi:hypothetical protein [Actinoplanes sp. NPDC051851]|uniref:hypothetical protein n=1 Tax=Actinoplanes sp. NPDC051851 TaxID=3154753 RepID=UPI00344201D7
MEIRYFGISRGHLTEAGAQSWIRSLGLPAAVEAQVHPTLTPFPHYAISLAVPRGLAVEIPPLDPRFADAALRASATRAAAPHTAAARTAVPHAAAPHTGAVHAGAVHAAAHAAGEAGRAETVRAAAIQAPVLQPA